MPLGGERVPLHQIWCLESCLSEAILNDNLFLFGCTRGNPAEFRAGFLFGEK